MDYYTYIYCVWILCACVVVQTQAICNCRTTAWAVIWSTSYFPNVSVFLLTALGGLPENPGISCSVIFAQNITTQKLNTQRVRVVFYCLG